jgi:NAD(P)-dependent dehydrogenase (short-subunit alcohol dehydrogenase family)
MSSDMPRRALVTGASRGIGQSTAVALAKAGFDLALISRSLDNLETTLAQVKATGAKAKPYAIDLADLEDIQPKFIHILDDFGTPSVLINNAGMGYTGALADTPLSDWQLVMDLNLTSVFRCIQVVLPAMRQAGGGTIVNVSSVAAKSAFPEWGAYTVSKAGLVALSKVLSAEERAHGIRVVTVSPGAVNTPIWDTDTVHADFDRSQMLTPDIVAETIVNTVLLPSHAVIEELTLMPSAGAL